MKLLCFLTLLFISFQGVYAYHIDSLGADAPLLEIVEHKADVPNNDIKLKFNHKHLYVPSLLIASSVALNGNQPGSFKNRIVYERNMRMPNFDTDIDDYMQYAPIALSYGLDAFGVPSKTDFGNRSAILLKAELLMAGSVYMLKKSIGQQRPDNGARNSYPSGHTAQAFVAAAYLSEEYKDRFGWMPYLAYGIASSVGALRMANNRHYVSDVLFGAGIGILSVKFSYWTHRYKWGFSK